MQWVYDSIAALRPMDVPGAKVIRTARGFAIIPEARTVAQQSTPATAAKYVIKEVFGDYYRCRSWDGTTEGAADVLIARNYKLRKSLDNETINGIAWHYSYDDSDLTGGKIGLIRSATATGQVTETHVIVPPICTGTDAKNGKGDEIIAMPIDGNSTAKDALGNPINLEDMNVDGRAWTKITAV